MMRTPLLGRIFFRASPCLVTLFLVASIADGAVSPEGSPSRQKLVLTGSSTIAPVMLEIGKRFEKIHPGTRIDVQSGGSSRGVADARSGVADIGMVSRALNVDEADLKAYRVAMDGISIILHKDNPVTALTREQVVGIFAGGIKNWKEVGGVDGDITVVNKAEGRSTLELFLNFYGLKASDIKAKIIIGENEQGIKTVAGNKRAIGYVSIGTAEYDASHGIPIKLLPSGEVAATVANIRNGTYPMARPLNLVTKSGPSALGKAFIEFAMGEKVRDIVESQYFVSVAEALVN